MAKDVFVPSCRLWPYWLAVAVVLCVHVALLAWLGLEQSPNIDEPAHLAAGMARWQYGVNDLYPVNPPLVSRIATLPILLLPHEEVWGDFENAPEPRPEFVLGRQFVESHPEYWRRFLIAGRWMLIPFSVLGGLVCFWWASELFGPKAGLLALTLWCFSPNVLAWSSVIGTDGIATAMGIAAGYLFWRWLKRLSPTRTLLAGLALGIAELTKMTWVILFGLWPLLWLVWRRWRGVRTSPDAASLGLVLLLGWNVLNLGYAFEGTFTPLGEFEFFSRVLSGETFTEDAAAGANRFATTSWGGLPVPFPRTYVEGLDLQRWDFEKGDPSYLFGKWSDSGWWYYYLVGLALKVPLGTWGLALLAMLAFLTSRFAHEPVSGSEARNSTLRARKADQLMLLIPALTVLVLVSSQDGFSIHFRYVLPVLPFAFVGISQAANWITRPRPIFSTVILGLALWSVASSLYVFPHCISYSHELAGGPANGHRYLLGSSFSWAQDHFYIRDWLRNHPEVDCPYMSLEHSIPPERAGLRTRGEPPKVTREIPQTDYERFAAGPVPGWHVMAVQRIHDRDGGFLYFLDLDPIATIGYSTYVYHVSMSDANRLRRNLRVPELKAAHSRDIVKELAEGRRAERQLDVALLNVSDDRSSGDSQMERIIESCESLSLKLQTEEEVQNGELEGFDVLVVPGGKAKLQGAALGSKGREAIRSFVHKGGGYVGVCAGAHLAVTNHDWSLKLVNARTVSGERFVPGQGKVGVSFRGWGVVDVEFTKEGQRVFDDAVNRTRLNYTGGPVLFRANNPNLPDYKPLAYFRSELWQASVPERYDD